MPEPMSLIQQVNIFRKSNRQHLIIDRTVRRRPPFYPSFNHIDNENIELKTLSFDVYTSKHLVNKTKSTLLPSERNRLDKFLPPIDKDNKLNENYRRRKKKSSLYHRHTPISTDTDLGEINARGLKPELHVIIPIGRDNDTVVSDQRDQVPPPSPSDDEIDRLVGELQDRNSSRSPTLQSPLEKDEYIPFRLPKLRQSARLQRTPMKVQTKDIRSTLSNYLQRYY